MQQGFIFIFLKHFNGHEEGKEHIYCTNRSLLINYGLLLSDIFITQTYELQKNVNMGLFFHK